MGRRDEGPESEAGGPAAVVSALRHALPAMGLRRTASTMLRINQADGFDCPGCAWPEPPPGERSHAEFCENGAKALAEEATTRRVERGFFAAHSVADLAERDDYWLGRHPRLTEPMVLRAGATHYEPLGWDDAFGLIAARLRSRAMGQGPVGVFFGLGGNFVAAAPDTDATASALHRCALTVHVSTKLNRSHVVTGTEALILPCLGRTERDGGQFVTVADSMGMVHASTGRLEPASPHLLSEVDSVRRAPAPWSGCLPIRWARARSRSSTLHSSSASRPCSTSGARSTTRAPARVAPSTC